MNLDFELSIGKHREERIAVLFELAARRNVSKQCRASNLDTLGGESAESDRYIILEKLDICSLWQHWVTNA